MVNVLFSYFSLCKFAKFRMSFLKAQVSFPSKSSVPSNITPLHFFYIIYFGQRSQLKSKFFRFSCARVKIRQILCVMSFSIVMTHNSSVNFKLIHFLLWTKGSLQSPNSDTFECSDENLPNSSCHFPNHKSVFFQIFHHSSVS